MKMTTAYAFIWISCSTAITAGIVVTGSLAPLWALLIPAMISVSARTEDES
ncbi:hypothetical protein [Paenibacillus selenitireducens]|uniref:hypothetical protein n=1 Tax=Paenibacillus selenitireducens TaxID=1324314 RepID=UPI001301D3A3|nr:hypothetical protein [Paenibacillus selenitireducens]